MAADADESARVTAELPVTANQARVTGEPPVTASRAGDRRVFTGRARPVLLPDLELTLLEEADDPTEVRRWFGSGGEGGEGGDGGGTEPTPDGPRPGAAARLAHGAMVAGLTMVAMLIMAVVIALAAR
jgi:hypothetical protein